MDKLQLAGQNLGRVFNSRSGFVCAMQLRCFETKLPNLMLKTWPKQLLGSLSVRYRAPRIVCTLCCCIAQESKESKASVKSTFVAATFAWGVARLWVEHHLADMVMTPSREY